MIGKISLVLSILLLAAVGYLFTQIDGKTAEPKEENTQIENAEPVDLGDTIALNDSVSILRHPVIAFVHGDSISTRYKWQLETQDALIKAQKRSEGRLKSKSNKMDAEVKSAEEFAQSGQMTEADYGAIQQTLAGLQMEYEQLQMTENEKLGKMQMDYQLEFYEKIEESLARYADANGIDIILNHQIGGNVLHAKGMNVTSEVISVLNAEYAAEKNSKEAGK